MKIFKNDRPIELNVKNYENMTRKTDPYYREDKREIKYYAICPACHNPVILVNLYVDKTIDESKRRMTLHAKHCKYDVPNLANYDQEAYFNCPFANPEGFGGSTRHTSKKGKNEIVSLIKNYPMVLFNEIRYISGVDFSEATFSKMIDKFIKSEGYYYKYVNKYNLPYSFLNMQKSISIFNNKLYFSPFKKEIIASFENSKHYKCCNDRILPRNNKDFVEIEFYFSNHSINKDVESEFIDIVIVEKFKGSENEIFRKTIPINLEKYINTIEKNRRVSQIVDFIEIEV